VTFFRDALFIPRIRGPVPVLAALFNFIIFFFRLESSTPGSRRSVASTSVDFLQVRESFPHRVFLPSFRRELTIQVIEADISGAFAWLIPFPLANTYCRAALFPILFQNILDSSVLFQTSWCKISLSGFCFFPSSVLAETLFAFFFFPRAIEDFVYLYNS